MARAGLHCQALPGPQCPAAGKQAVPGPVTGPTTLCTNWSWMESSTKSRPAAMQFSPLLKKTELMPCAEGRTALGYSPWGSPPPPAVLTICTALPRSQSAKMRRGDFPPSSRETFFTLLRAQLKGTGRDGLGHGVGDTGHGTRDIGHGTRAGGRGTRDMGAEGSSSAGSLGRAAEDLGWRVPVRPAPPPLPHRPSAGLALVAPPHPQTLSPFRLTPEGGRGAPLACEP